MANRIVGTVVIIDSAMGNAFILTSANIPLHYTQYHVSSVSFWSSDTTGRLIMSAADTTNHLVSMGWLTNSAGGVSPATQEMVFNGRQNLDSLKVPNLTAGTAWLYLC